MVVLRNLFNISYQRSVVPDYHGFFLLFYEKLVKQDPAIAELFRHTDMKKQVEMLMESITHITSFSATLEASEEIDRIANIHGKGKLDLPSAYYDVWMDSLLETVKERDPKYDQYIERAWRTVMAPGIEYMKSFCSR